jgi:hypothetical protein
VAHQPDLSKLRGAAEDLAVFGTAAVIHQDNRGDGLCRQRADQLEQALLGAIGGNDHRETYRFRVHQ